MLSTELIAYTARLHM